MPGRPPGPLELRLWQLGPALDPVPGWVLAGPPEAEAAAIRDRCQDQTRRCVLCGGPARFALIARPAARWAPPFWVDLDAECRRLLGREVAASFN